MSASGSLRRLLLATERTEFDRGAERVAIALARAAGTSLSIVLPFATNEELLSTEPALALESEVKAAAGVRALVGDAHSQGVLAEATVRRGASLWQEIVAAAAQGADLLITRRVGRRGLLARLLVGEMVSRVAAHATCPVLMAPTVAAGLWTRRVIVPASAARHVEALSDALAAAGDARVERHPGGCTEVAAAAGKDDLLVLPLGVAQVAAGRLAADVVEAIGLAPCPVVLIGPGVPTGA